MRKRGVLPMHPSMPAGMGGAAMDWRVLLVWSSSFTGGRYVEPGREEEVEDGWPRRRWYRRSRSGYRSLRPRVRRTPVVKAMKMAAEP